MLPGTVVYPDTEAKALWTEPGLRGASSVIPTGELCFVLSTQLHPDHADISTSLVLTSRGRVGWIIVTKMFGSLVLA